MIQMDNGTRVYARGEWNASKRYSAVFHARKLGGQPTTQVVDGVLIVWPAGVDWIQRGMDIETLYRVAGGATSLDVFGERS